MRAQQDTFRQDFENACVNLRNNNAQISSMQSQMDCIKVQQRQLQRQQAEAPAAVPAETAAAHDSAPVARPTIPSNILILRTISAVPLKALNRRKSSICPILKENSMFWTSAAAGANFCL